MWFTQEVFSISSELKSLGVEPRFEVGDVVARGFADLGFEEFQVLPGPSLLSLTAGTMKPLPVEHRQYFFWIPSVDEVVDLLEQRGATIRECVREDSRYWRVVVGSENTPDCIASARILHEALLRVLQEYLTKRAAGS